MKKIILLVTIFLFCATSAQALTKKGDLTVVSTNELKAMLDQNKPMTLVNTMPPLIHQTKHIPGSINIPVGEIEAKLPEALSDKNGLVVFYCMGLK